MTKFVFDNEGRLFREDTTSREITLTPGILASVCRGEPVAVPALIRHPELGLIGLSADPKVCWWTIRMKSLMLRCRFRHLDDLTIVPDFSSDSSPVLSVRWTPPDDMKLILFVQTAATETGGFKNSGPPFLFAVSDDKNLWRFPIGNLYDDCRLCLGEDRWYGKTQLEVLEAVFTQLEKSEWNADLWTGERAENTRKLFRFKVENSGFTQLPTDEDRHWTSLCNKVGLAIAERIVI